MASLLSYALTNLSDVKESLGIASSVHTYDNLIIRKINQATLAIENYCGRRFKETTYTQEEYDATHIDELILRQRPITATQAFLLEVRNTDLNSDSWETVDTSLFHRDNNAAVVEGLIRFTGRWNRWRITYSAGYATIPDDLAEACASLAVFYFNNADGTLVGTMEKQEGQRKLRYSNTNNTLSFDNIMAQLGIDQIVNNYANNPVLTDR